MKKTLKEIIKTFGIQICRYHPPAPYATRVVSLKPNNRSRGNVLLSYIIKPFLENTGEPHNISSSIIWECSQRAQTFLDLGYSVDIINYQNRSFIPDKDYSIFVDIQRNLERLAPLLNKDCIKILHPLWAHWLFNNYASHKRFLELQQRKGVTIKEQRLLEPNQAIENADYAIIKGNEFSLSTYSFANKPLFRVPQTIPVLLPQPEAKNLELCRKNFLWLSGGGMVHKGLDLALEAFAEMPDYHLYVCGALQEEVDFEKLYYRELYETPNIHTLGWIDLKSPEFVKIVSNCIGHIHLSCSECSSGSVIQCMQAGLIPIASYESGVDVNDFGVIVKDCSVDVIKKTIETVASLPAGDLKEMSQKAWEFTRENHTRERAAEDFRKIILQIIEYDHLRNGNKMAMAGQSSC